MTMKLFSVVFTIHTICPITTYAHKSRTRECTVSRSHLCSSGVCLAMVSGFSFQTMPRATNVRRVPLAHRVRCAHQKR